MDDFANNTVRLLIIFFGIFFSLASELSLMFIIRFNKITKQLRQY